MQDLIVIGFLCIVIIIQSYVHSKNVSDKDKIIKDLLDRVMAKDFNEYKKMEIPTAKKEKSFNPVKKSLLKEREGN